MVCLDCDKNMIWQNDFSPEDYGLNDVEGVVSVWYCTNCDKLTSFLLIDDEVFILDMSNGGYPTLLP